MLDHRAVHLSLPASAARCACAARLVVSIPLFSCQSASLLHEATHARRGGITRRCHSGCRPHLHHAAIIAGSVRKMRGHSMIDFPLGNKGFSIMTTLELPYS